MVSFCSQTCLIKPLSRSTRFRLKPSIIFSRDSSGAQVLREIAAGTGRHGSVVGRDVGTQEYSPWGLSDRFARSPSCDAAITDAARAIGLHPAMHGVGGYNRVWSLDTAFGLAFLNRLAAINCLRKPAAIRFQEGRMPENLLVGSTRGKLDAPSVSPFLLTLPASHEHPFLQQPLARRPRIVTAQTIQFPPELSPAENIQQRPYSRKIQMLTADHQVVPLALERDEP